MTQVIDNAWLDQLNWNEQGLVSAIAQDAETGDVLMQAWMNRESLALTLQERRAVYWSRSRQQLWRKGEQSGNVQELVDIYLDCDGDSLLLKVHQIGGIACHTGRRQCYYRQWQKGEWVTISDVITSPQQLYGNKDE